MLDDKCEKRKSALLTILLDILTSHQYIHVLLNEEIGTVALLSDVLLGMFMSFYIMPSINNTIP